MSESNDPVRWRDDPKGLPDELVDSLPRYTQLGPSAELHARIFESIEQGLVGPAGAGSPTIDLGVRAGWKLKLVVGGALALVLVGGYGLRQRAQTHREVPEARRAAPVAPSTAVDAAPPAALKTALVLSDAGAPVVANPVPAPRVRKTRVLQPSEPAALEPQAELSLLSRARRVLASSPARALELTDEHAADFARGMFVQEREVIAIEALFKLDRVAEARARAESFECSHPRSTHLERIRVILSAP